MNVVKLRGRVLIGVIATVLAVAGLLVPALPAQAATGFFYLEFEPCDVNYQAPANQAEAEDVARQIVVKVENVDDSHPNADHFKFSFFHNSLNPIQFSTASIIRVAFDQVAPQLFSTASIGITDSDLVDGDSREDVRFVRATTSSTADVFGGCGDFDIHSRYDFDWEIAAASTPTFQQGVNVTNPDGDPEWLTIDLTPNTSFPGAPMHPTFQDVMVGLFNGDIHVAVGVFVDNHRVYKLVSTGKFTPVTLREFNVSPEADGVALTWTTGVEVDNAGFNVLRSASAEGPFTRVNPQLIAGQGNGNGASYRYVDTTGAAADYYRLEDVDFGGKSTVHSPTEVAAIAQPVRLFVPVTLAD